MNTVSLPERYQNLFFNYIEPLKIKCDTFTVVRHEDNDMVVPANTTFTIDFEDSVVVVDELNEQTKLLETINTGNANFYK